MGDFVYFGRFFDIKNNIYKGKTNEIFKKYNRIYFLINGRIAIVDKNSYNEFIIPDSSPNHIFVDEKIYVSGEDTGSIYIYSLNGELLNSIKLGEHISDFFVKDQVIYGITYHDNFLVKSTINKNVKKITLDDFPQRIFIKKHIYVLLNNELYSSIRMFDNNLDFIKSIYFKRQVGDLFYINNKIIFNGDEYNYILTENLILISQKNSSGRILHNTDKKLISEDNMVLDIINNIIYPL